MTFEDSPEARDEIDRLLDPDNFVEEDSCHTSGTLLDMGRILIRTLRSLTEDQKAEIRGDFTSGDKAMLRQMGICS